MLVGANVGTGVGGSGVAVGGTGVAVGARRVGRRVGTGVLVAVGSGVLVGTTVGVKVDVDVGVDVLVGARVGVGDGALVCVGVMTTAGKSVPAGAVAVAMLLPDVTGMRLLRISNMLNAQVAKAINKINPKPATMARNVPRRGPVAGNVAGVVAMGAAGKTPVWPVT